MTARLQRALRWTALITALVALPLAGKSILIGAARFMTVDTPIDRADIVVPLYHDASAIPAVTAHWLKSGYATTVVVYRPNPTRVERLGLRPAKETVMRSRLVAHGVPADRIAEIGNDIKNAKELVDAIAAFLNGGSGKRVILVAASPHSRLAWLDVKDAMTSAGIDVRMAAVSPASFDESNWWKSRDGMIAYFDVYCLWLLRFVR